MRPKQEEVEKEVDRTSSSIPDDHLVQHRQVKGAGADEGLLIQRQGGLQPLKVELLVGSVLVDDEDVLVQPVIEM